ncbi:MAG: element excision factor XisI family protein [Bacteroidota bacterium]
MDKSLKYKKGILAALAYPLQGSNSDMPNVKSQLIVDETAGSYVMFMFGWYKEKYIHTLMFHMEIRAEKVWIYENNTDYPIEEALIESGVDDQDIIFAWDTPYELESLSIAA